MNFGHLRSVVRGRWAALEARERRLVLLAVSVVCVGVLFSLAEWGVEQRAKLAGTLPLARAQLQQMQDEADELGRLRQASPRPLGTLAARAEAARAAARGRNLSLAIELSENGLAVVGEAPSEALLDWIASMHGEQRMRVERLDAKPAGGLLKVDGRLHAMGDD